MPGKTIVVALSGGIDSLTAAHILKKEGHRVIGVHFTTGYEKIPDKTEPSIYIKHKIDHLQEALGIKVHAVDLQRPFQNLVVRYFVDGYRRGITPNPCLVCNPSIKFGLLLEWAQKLGAQYLATGHYARLRVDADKSVHLLKGHDDQKDQSYFLARMSRRQLRSVIFPLGDFIKADVIAMAKANGLEAVEKGESQDVCFIQGTKNRFLKNMLGFVHRPGPIVDSEGKTLGRHDGLYRYTIGQRKGINIPAGHAYYVIKIDVATNRLVVGKKKDTFADRCTVSGINWINLPPQSVFRASVRIRYRHQAAPATVEAQGSHALVKFDEPQSAITPGQGAVFYQADEVLGGGWIE